MVLNLIFVTLSAELSLIIMLSDEIYSLGLFMAGLQPLHASGIMSVAQTAGAAGNSHL